MTLSVIIPTRNRADLLGAALNSLTLQTCSLDSFEVLVVDNGSTDSTKPVVESYIGKLPGLRYFYEQEPGLHVGRHCGLREAGGDILVYADDDIEALPSWLSSIAEAFADPNVAMVGGNNLPLFLLPPPAWLNAVWNDSDYEGGRALPPLSIIELSGGIREVSPYQVWGCNFSIRKAVLLDAGGFHPDGMPAELIRFRGDGETHVSRYVAESKMKCLFHPGASVFHKVTPERMTYEYFYRRGYNQGISDSYTRLRNQGGEKQSGSIKVRLKRLLTRVWRLLVGKFTSKASDSIALEKMKVGHTEGYIYHQKMYRENSEVRAWVHRANYY